jgi:SAM-dependent methyltransferase
MLEEGARQGMNLWIFILLGAAAALFLLKAAYVLAVAATVASTRGALYVSTSRRRIQALLDALPLEKDQVVVDLGCGDGRTLRAARRRFSVRAVGYEINPLAYLKARFCCALKGPKGLDIRYKNFWKAGGALDEADAIFCYLFPDVMADLAEKIKAEARPGARVVSFNFPIPAFCPEQVLRPEGAGQNDPIYIYRVPEPVIGAAS